MIDADCQSMYLEHVDLDVEPKTVIEWIEVSEDNLPEHGQRVLFHKPSKLTKIGEMIYFKTDKECFMEQVSHWAPAIKKPDEVVEKEEAPNISAYIMTSIGDMWFDLYCDTSLSEDEIKETAARKFLEKYPGTNVEAVVKWAYFF